MLLSTVNMADNRAKNLAYGETKKMASYLLTPTAKQLVADMAQTQSLTNGECLERLIRYSAPKILSGEISLNSD